MLVGLETGKLENEKIELWSIHHDCNQLLYAFFSTISPDGGPVNVAKLNAILPRQRNSCGVHEHFGS